MNGAYIAPSSIVYSPYYPRKYMELLAAIVPIQTTTFRRSSFYSQMYPILARRTVQVSITVFVQVLTFYKENKSGLSQVGHLRGPLAQVLPYTT